MTKILAIIISILFTQNAFSAEFSKVFSWDQGNNWYPAVWQAVDEGFHPPSWSASTAYNVGDQVASVPYAVPGIYYTCTRAGTSGATKPEWKWVDGELFDDPDPNGVQWEVHNINLSYYTWMPYGVCNQGDIVLPIQSYLSHGWHFLCAYAGRFGGQEPAWQLIDGQQFPGSAVNKPVIVRIFSDSVEIGQGYDNNIPDQQTELSINWSQPAGRHNITATAELAAGPAWKPATSYMLDDVVVASTIFGDGYVYFKCTRAGTSGTTEPNWSDVDGTVIDDPDGNGVEWTVYNTSPAPWQPSTVYSVGDVVSPTSQKLPGNYVYVCTRSGTSGGNEPDWEAEQNVPWYAVFRYWLNDHNAVYINDPDENGVQWRVGRRIYSVSTLPARTRIRTGDTDESITPIGRVRN